ncbi:unnamed protein product [Anisakis simplex]|uniref:GCV_T domain-containing protein n=1 Tax=Anisakis simplex TaxID=6269 RepID=A0A0M3JTM3_ANISI|nr:unnamed protein product [Anisakis simplex]
MVRKGVIHLVQRALLSLKGRDTRQLLQGLTTNDLSLLRRNGALYTLLLNNRGRIEYDLIVYERNDDEFLVECDSDRRDTLKRLLQMYRMHKNVVIEPSDTNVFFVNQKCDGAFIDPRIPAFGTRLLADRIPDSDASNAMSVYEDRRFEFGLVEGNAELRGALPVYRNADIMNGMSYDKGCYLGQEVSAQTLRNKIRKRIVPFTCDGRASGLIVDPNDGSSNMGNVIACNGHRGLALLRLDRITSNAILKANDISIKPRIPACIDIISINTMSEKQFRRYLMVTGQLENKHEELGVKDNNMANDEIDDTEVKESVSMNRFELLGDESDHNTSDENGDVKGDKITDKEDEESTGRMATGNISKAKHRKSRKKQKKRRENIEDSLDITNDASSERETNEPPDNNSKVVFEADIFKIDPRNFDYDKEFSLMLGQKPKKRPHHQSRTKNRLAYGKSQWPVLKNTGFHMELDKVERGVSFYRFKHNALYQGVQQLFWTGFKLNDESLLMELLVEHPFHLDTLLTVANTLSFREEYSASHDLIERGIFACESMFAAQFSLTDFNHRLEYKQWENRAFFLLLHRHMNMLLDRGLVQTALTIAKLIYKLDPVEDPLGILLIIDSLALKANQPKLKARRLERLPNFAYSIALAHFELSRESGDRSSADHYLAQAIRRFPTMVSPLLTKINVQPDENLEKNTRLNEIAYQKETEGMKLLICVYIDHAHELWNDNDVLKWFEEITKLTIETFDQHTEEIREWDKTRGSCYGGIPRNVRRHATLWHLRNGDEGEMVLVDPSPPVLSFADYQPVGASSFQPPQSWLLTVVSSLIPDDAQVNVGFISSNINTNDNIAHK